MVAIFMNTLLEKDSGTQKFIFKKNAHICVLEIGIIL